MKTAKEWLEDARLAHKFEQMMKGYEIYDGELENLAGGFWCVQLDNMGMAGLKTMNTKPVKRSSRQRTWHRRRRR